MSDPASVHFSLDETASSISDLYLSVTLVQSSKQIRPLDALTSCLNAEDQQSTATVKQALNQPADRLGNRYTSKGSISQQVLNSCCVGEALTLINLQTDGASCSVIPDKFFRSCGICFGQDMFTASAVWGLYSPVSLVSD